MSVYLLFLRKELHDIHRNGQILAIHLVIPLVFVAIMVGFAAFSTAILRTDANDPVILALVRQVTSAPDLATLPQDVAFTAFAMRALLAFFLLMPVVLSSTLAAYSIVGEKQQRTLEPVLATPISDREFLLGKMLASLIPPLSLTWIAGLIAALGVGAVTWSRWQLLLVPDRYWFVALGVLAPVLGTASVLATMRMSARATDPQAAVQTSALFFVPGFLLMVSVVGKVLMQSVIAGLVGGLLLGMLDVWLFRNNVRKFAREEILTRWG